MTAVLHQVDALRYTPAGVPVLNVILQHESWQNENETPCKIVFQLPARIIGSKAIQWQHQQGKCVLVKGCLAQQSQRNTRPMMRIQNIQEYKG